MRFILSRGGLEAVSRPYPPLRGLTLCGAQRVPGVLTGTRRNDSPAFDRLDRRGSCQPKAPGRTYRPIQAPVGSKV